MTSKFVNQARFAHARLTDHRQDLAFPARYLFNESVKDFDFAPAPNQWRQPASSPSLDPSARRRGTDELVCFDEMRNPLRLHRAQRLHLNKPFDLPQSRGRH